MPKILSIQDLSCYGQCSNSVALPILSTFGIETIILPTMILSTHTGGFKNIYIQDLSESIDKICQSWQDNNISFDAIYIGYLGSTKLIEKTITIINYLKKRNTLVFFTPACADNGKLYQGFNDNYLEKLRSLCFYADYIVANVTEAFFLMNCEYQAINHPNRIYELIHELTKKFLTNMIITGIEMNKDEIYVLFKQYHSHQITSFKEQKINGNYHGTGDIFLSYMIGKYFISHEMNISIQEAMKFVKDAIVLTKEDTNHSYGIKFEKVLRGFYEKANQSK